MKELELPVKVSRDKHPVSFRRPAVYKHVCKVCGAEYLSSRRLLNQKYCTERCRARLRYGFKGTRAPYGSRTSYGVRARPPAQLEWRECQSCHEEFECLESSRRKTCGMNCRAILPEHELSPLDLGPGDGELLKLLTQRSSD